MHLRPLWKIGLGLLLLGALCVVVHSGPELAAVAQQPTGSIPTVTGTPTGPTVAVDPSLEWIYVYSGPSTIDYPPIGVLLTGVRVPALGRAADDDNWIEIRYPGVPGAKAWVYALYVSLSAGSGEMPRIEAPPTPTPASTPTINPTLAAAFIPAEAATRLPTFTAVAPLAVPTFVDDSGNTGRIPVGLLIIGSAVVGALGTLISFLRGR